MRRSPWHQPSGKSSKKTKSFLLDQFSSADIKKWERKKDLFLKYYWDFHSSLAFQRAKIADEIRKSLLQASNKEYVITKWQRIVRHEFSVEPLSLLGSLRDPGGRFNIGNINPIQFQSFPALYIAFDKETALQEALCQKMDPKDFKKSYDFALTDPTSVTSVSVSGRISSIIDLNQPNKLQPFVDLLKDFTIPDHLIKIAKLLKFEEKPELIKTIPKLIEGLLLPNWREWPMQFDVPVAS